jgi:hypothetical protein
MSEDTKNSKEDEQPSADDKPEALSIPKKRSWIGTIWKILIRTLVYSVFFIFLLIAAAVIVLEYYFPAEEARLFAESQVTKHLKLPLKIQKIGFSLFSGLRLDGLALGFPNMPVARVKTVVLDYDLTQLLQGQLVINQILVDDPQLTAVSKKGVWNFQPLLDLTKPSPTPVDKDKPASSLPLPEIDIKEFTLRNASAHLDQDGKINAHIDGLSLEAQGKASLTAIDLKLKVLMNPDTNKPSNVEFQSKGVMSFQSRIFSNLDFSASNLNQLSISGGFGLQNNRVSMEALTLPSPDVAVLMDAEVSMQPEILNLKKFEMALGKNNRVKVSGRATDFSKDPSVNLMIDTVSFQLKDILTWGKQWIPPLSGHGLLNATGVKINGHLPGFTLKDLSVKGGTLSTKNLWVNLPDQNAQIEDMNADLKLKNIALKNSQLEEASVKLNMRLKKGTVQKAEIKDWNQSLDITAKGNDLTDIILDFSSDIKSLHYDHPETQEVFLPVHAEGSGHLLGTNFNNLKLSFRLGTLASGKVTGNVKNLGKNSFQLDQNLNINLAELVRRLPKKLTADLIESIDGNAQAQASVTGKLDDGFSPVELKGLANFQLEGLTTHLKQPSANISNLNARISFPFEFDATKGARITHLSIHTDLQNAKALETVQVNALELNAKLLMEKFYNLKPEFGTFPVQIETQVTLGNLKTQQPALSLDKFSTDITVKADLQTDDVRNTRVEGNLSFKNLSALDMLKTPELLSQFKLDVHDKSLTRVHLSQKTQIKKPSFYQEGLKLNLGSVRLESLSLQNLKDGEVDLQTFILQSQDLVNAQLKATLKEWGNTFALEGQIDSLQLASLWNLLPDAFKADMETLKTGGTVNIKLKTKGSLPVNPQEGNGAESVMPSEPLWIQLLVPDKTNDKTPVEIETEFQLNNGLLHDPKRKIQAEALNNKTRLTFKNGHGDIEGNFSGKLEGLAKNPLNPEFEYHYVLDNLNTLKIKQNHLKLMDGGVQLSLEGYLQGLKPFVTGKSSMGANELLSKLDINLANTNTIDINETVTSNAAELLGDLEAQGKIESKIRFRQSAGKNLSLAGSLGFDQFNLTVPSKLALENLAGTFPFSKSLQLDPKQMKEKSSVFSPAQKKFFTPLRDFSHYKNIIRMDSLEVSEQTLKDIGLDVVFKDNRLMAEKFIFDVLGGSMGGNLFLIQDQQGPVIKFSTEFAGIDASKLLAIPLKKKIDSKVDGNLQVKLKIKTGFEDQPVSLDQLSVKIAITRIGAQTLDRLLLFIDPEESKPAIMDTRAKLKLASPHRVVINLENGNLNVEAWLKSDLLGIIKAPELKRIPIAALKRFNTIHEQLQALKGLEQISNYLSARGLQFKDEEMILHY